MLDVVTVGNAVPVRDWHGTVHSVFARACNVATGGGVVTIGAAPFAGGPATVVIDARGVADLRTLFRPGERFEWREEIARSPRAVLDLTRAQRWRPPPARKTLPRRRVAPRLTVRLHGPRLRLARACRAGHVLRAAALARGLIGLGPGLTPSGDDFLVGLCAGLAATAGNRRLRARLATTLVQQQSRTTTLSAQQLRLAAAGMFNEDVLRARDALLACASRARLREALATLRAAGATSGAAACDGLLAGLAAQRR